MLGLAVTLAVVITTVLFTISNAAPVSLGFWPLESRLVMPLWVVGLCGVAIGLVLGAFAMLIPLAASRLERRRLARSLNALEKSRQQSTEKNPAEGKPDETLLPPPQL